MKNLKRFIAIIRSLSFFAFLPVFLAGCATVRGGRDATFTPGWKRVQKAVVGAVLSPEVWVPLSGAAIIKVSGTDGKISNWASEHTPVYGSQKKAIRYSNNLVSAAVAANVAAALAVPRGKQSQDWIASKLKIAAVDLTAEGFTFLTTSGIKKICRRLRPDKSDYQSFPSGHTSSVAVNSILASRSVKFLPVSTGSKTALNISFLALTAGTGWARVEAKKHFPTDALAGAALGNFFGIFLNDALFVTDNPGVSLNIQPAKNNCRIKLCLNY